jgi:hypothetical protein
MTTNEAAARRITLGDFIGNISTEYAPQNAASHTAGVGTGRTSRKIISTDGNLHVASNPAVAMRGAYRIDVFTFIDFA